MGNLVAHARRELELLGYDEEDTKNIMAVINAFDNKRFSVIQASVYISVITKLLRHEPLSELTDDPDEWEYVVQKNIFQEDADVWQNKRNTKAFSNDGGKTYYILSEMTGKTRQYRDTVRVNKTT